MSIIVGNFLEILSWTHHTSNGIVFIHVEQLRELAHVLSSNNLFRRPKIKIDIDINHEVGGKKIFF